MYGRVPELQNSKKAINIKTIQLIKLFFAFH